jgi:hypothetical protein
MRFASILPIGILIAFSMVFSQEGLEIEGSGEGADLDLALLAAKRDVIEKGIGAILLSQVEIENFQLKRDLVITKALDAVKSYSILSQSKSSDGQIQIKMKAVLLKNILREDLALLQVSIESMDKPRVMVVVNECNIENNDPGNQAAENAIVTFLQNPYAFDLIDQKTVVSIKNSKQKMAILKDKVIEAAAVGTQYGAEVLIVGTATSKRDDGVEQNLGGMISVQAEVILKAINCSTGKIIGSTTEHATKVHISPQTAGAEAIASAAEKGAKILLDLIIKDWQHQANNGMPLSVLISNVTTSRSKNAIVQTLKGITGVRGVHERNWDTKKNILNIDIQYKGNPNGFSAIIDGYKLKTGGGSLGVTGINGQNIILAAQAM